MPPFLTLMDDQNKNANSSCPSTAVTQPSGTDLVTRYPSHFINQNITDRPSSTTVVHKLVDGQALSGTFLGPVDLREVYLSTDGLSVAIVESHRLPLNVAARILLPLLLVIAFLANMFVLRNTYRLSRFNWPLAVYFVYLGLLDQVDLLCCGTDYLVEAFTDIRLLTAVQFLSRGACQILISAYSTLKHIQATLVIGLAIDTWRLCRNPARFTVKYRREWTKNVMILAAALAFTTDSQFFWTFDLTQLENKQIHERLVQNAYECSFITSSTVSPVFIDYVWPMVDHFWGDLLPLIACAFTGLFVIIRINMKGIHSVFCTEIHVAGASDSKVMDTRQRLLKAMDFWNSTRSLSTRSDSRGVQFQEALGTLANVCILQATMVLPRTIYYLTKFGLFTRGGVNEEHQQEDSDDHRFQQLRHRVTHLRQYEVSLEAIESLLRYLPMINIILRTYVLHRGIATLRHESCLLYQRLKTLGRRCIFSCSNCISFIQVTLARGCTKEFVEVNHQKSAKRYGEETVVKNKGNEEQSMHTVNQQTAMCSYQQQVKIINDSHYKDNGLGRHTRSTREAFTRKPVNPKTNETAIGHADVQHFQVYSL